MAFTTQIFTFLFLPCCVLTYLLVDRISTIKRLSNFFDKIRAKDIILIVFSLGFYSWACFDNVFRLCIYIVLLYILALFIVNSKNKNRYILINNATEQKKFYLCKIPFVIAISSVLFFLIYYNYHDFLIEVWNSALGDSLTPKSLVGPLGLSFITFSAISYLVDIYRGDAQKGSLIDCFLYITFFRR